MEVNMSVTYFYLFNAGVCGFEFVC